jgi:esterase/lipase superfamily enzyme
MRLIFSLFLTLGLLSSCAGRPGADVLEAVNTRTKDTKIVTAFVASTREKNTDAKKGFGTARAMEPNYASFDISISSSLGPIC